MTLGLLRGSTKHVRNGSVRFERLRTSRARYFGLRLPVLEDRGWGCDLVDGAVDQETAIKVLRDSFADDPDWLARFEREAQLLASLNHPDIAIVHGLEEAGSAATSRPSRVSRAR